LYIRVCVYIVVVCVGGKRRVPGFFSAIIHRRVSPCRSITLPPMCYVLKGKNNVVQNVYIIMMHILLLLEPFKKIDSVIETRTILYDIVCAVYSTISCTWEAQGGALHSKLQINTRNLYVIYFSFYLQN